MWARLSSSSWHWVVYQQEIWLHWLWQKVGEASVTASSLSWFSKNIPHATQLGRVAFHSPRFGPVTLAVFSCVWIIKTGRRWDLPSCGSRQGNLGQRNHFYRFSSGAQLHLSCLSPSLADWLEYVDRQDKVLSLQSIAVTQHLIPAPLT